MRRPTRIWFAVVLAALAVGIVGLGAPTTLAKGKRPKVVKVLDDYYTPTTVKIKKGTKVKWKWGQDFNNHNVTLKKGPKRVKRRQFRSQTSPGPFTFTKRFKKIGKYRFYCTVHPDVMQMTVRVHR